MGIDSPNFFDNTSFQDFMKGRRQFAGLTHEQLSRVTKLMDPTTEGVSRVALSRYETGASLPGMRELRLIALALRCPLSLLVYGEQRDPMLPYRLELEMRIMERVNDMIFAEGVIKDESNNDPVTPEYRELIAQVKQRKE